MLKMLPSTYQNTSTLLKLFNILGANSGNYNELFRNNKTLMRQCWSFEFIQDIAKSDNAIAKFLEGYWTGSGYYLQFYENEDGGTSCRYNLPWVSQPYGTKYYDIEGLIFYWEDANDNKLAKVYRFEIVDFDTIRVYCYKDGRTYTLTR